MKKRLFTLSILMVLFLHMSIVLYAQDSIFYIEVINGDGEATQIATSTSYEDAVVQYNEATQGTNNVILRDNERIWNVKYGVAVIKKSDACDYNVSYTQGSQSGYTNGCYGIDAAYLSTSEDGSTMDLLISNAYGSFSSDDVTLQPIERSVTPSSFLVKDGYLNHRIKSQMQDEGISTSVNLGKAPEYLQEGKSYYSYDAHYFYLVDESYQGFYDMIDDLRSQTHSHAVNATNPYYNYYQYLTHRTTTNYSEEEINSYIDEHLHITSNLTSYKSIGNSAHAILTQSILKKQGAAFLQYQDQFGVNALMMMSLSMNESAMGRSYLAYTRNNLFGHAAFDSAVEENASRYQNASTSIYSHALHYLNDSYLNPKQFQYHGGWFGNKASGMNVSYASDPYWGEKAAQYYQRMDEALGAKDENAYALGIVASQKNVSIYQEASEDSNVLYTNEQSPDVSFILLAEDGDWYKVQSDPSNSTSSIYDFKQSVGYVKKADIDVVINEENIKEKQYVKVTFDAVDGSFEHGDPKLLIEVEAGKTPSVLAPSKDGYLFQSWNQELSPATRDITYTAQYEMVSKASITTIPKQHYTTGEFLDVKGGILEITLANGEVKEIPLDSTMVSGYDNETIGEQTLQVTYQGVSTAYSIQMKEGSNQEELLSRIQTLLDEIGNPAEITATQQETLQKLKEELNTASTPSLTQAQYRKLDKAIQEVYGNSLQIVLSDDDVDLQASGLAIAQAMKAPSFIPSILKLSFDSEVEKDAETLLSEIAQANEYMVSSTFTLSGSYNFQDLVLQDDVILSIEKPEKDTNLQYLILKYEDGEVSQLNTYQSENRISFICDSLGEYALVKRATTNTYTGNDIEENNTLANNGIDFFKLILIACICILCLIVLLLTIIIRKKRRKPASTPPSRKKRKKAQEQSNSFLSKHSILVDDTTIKDNSEHE